MRRRERKKRIDIVDIIMLGIVLILGIYIIFLGFKLLNVSKNDKKDKLANLVVPVLSEGTSSTLKISLDEFKVGDKYVLKITNFRQNDVSNKEVTYTINFKNPSEADISVFKNESTNDYATGEKEFSIADNKLMKKEKQSDIYYIKLNSDKNISKDSKVTINIES